MTRELRERHTYTTALGSARARLSEAAATLASAPAWERPEGPWAEARADLAGLLALEAALDEFDAPFLDRRSAELGLLGVLETIASGEDLLAALAPDPRRRFGPDPTMSRDSAETIVAEWAAGAHGIADVQALLGGVSVADRDDLVSTGRRHFEASGSQVPEFEAPGSPIHRRQSVGVLLPLRLETRFAAPDDASPNWRLKLRVYPEDVAFDRHPGDPTAKEVEHTQAMWRACEGALGTEEGKAAFMDLAGKVGGPRAAWLARTLSVARPEPAGPIEVRAPAVRDESVRVFHRPAGLPPRLEVWIARGGSDPVRVGEPLRLRRRAIAEQVDIDALFVGGVDPAEPDGPPPKTWWNSFEEAVRVGLGTELDLGPDEPDDIDAIYVAGLTAIRPHPLFRAHQAAGRLAVLAPGTPTNTVAGDPAADLGRDPEVWYQLATESGFDMPAARELALGLGGGRDLGALPGGGLDLRETTEALVAALFPVVVGRTLKDVWGFGESIWDLGTWARRSLAPQGPFPAIRVGDQPYGILPATVLARWAPHPSDPEIEHAVAFGIRFLIRDFARLADGAGTVVEADTGRLLELLSRTPTSGGWTARRVFPFDLLRAVAIGFGGPDAVRELERVWGDGIAGAYDALDTAVLEAGHEGRIRLLRRRFLPYGYAQPLPDWLWGAPEPQQQQLPIRRMLRSTNRRLVNEPDPEWGDDERPAPLLARLVRHSLIVTNAEMARLFDFDRPWGPELLPPMERPEDLADLAGQDVRHDPDPERAGQLTSDQLQLDLEPHDITDRIENRSGATVARAWEAVRDGVRFLASSRARPEQVEGALRALLDSASHRVDPWATGVAARRLRWLHNRNVRWQLGAYGWVDAPRRATRDDLLPGPTSAGLLHAPSPMQALAAAVLRDHAVRDDGVARWDLTLDSKKVRDAAKLADEVRTGGHPKEALGRLVEELAGDPGHVEWLRGEFRMRPGHEGRRVCDGEEVIRAAQQDRARFASAPAGMPVAAFEELGHVVDTYGDLLVADAVFDVVSGRADLAAEAMEAAGGFGAPPELRLLRTPREGATVPTTVLAVLPPGQAPGPDASPGALADPALAALLAHETGDPTGPEWSWRVEGDAPVTVTLAELGLAPVDVLTIPAGALAGRVRVSARAEIGAPVHEPPGAARARALAELLAGSAGLPRTPPGFEGVLVEAAQRLSARLAALVATAERLLQALADTPEAALAEAERWGLQPAEGDPADRAAAAAAVLAERLDAERAGAAIGVASPVSHDDVATLIRRVRALVGAADLPVVCTVPRAALAAALQPEGASARDTDWLPIVAAVRPPLARLEALQLDRDTAPWSTWSTHPGELWRTADERARAAAEQVVAYGPANALVGEDVGVALLDRFAETVPSSTHVTSAAFGFNGPKARAPQSIVLAVPPDVAKPLDVETVVAILGETRQLARARMVTSAELGAYRVPLPAPLLLGWGQRERFANVDLETKAAR